jgi:hypothetical protein
MKGRFAFALLLSEHCKMHAEEKRISQIFLLSPEFKNFGNI